MTSTPLHSPEKSVQKGQKAHNLPHTALAAIPPTERTVALVADLARVWEESVRASHDFLSEKDIESLRPLVCHYFGQIEHLLVASCEARAVAFMGIQGEKIEMLFIAPPYMGKGLGRQLVQHAIGLYGTSAVDVNEQNPQARDFYLHMGFETYERTETDEQGNPFPILKMRLKKV